MKFKTAAFAVLIAASPACAQMQGPRLNSLMPAGSRVDGLDVSTAPPSFSAPVEVITGTEMENAGYTSAIDALSLLPGVFVRRTNTFGRADADIRGWGDNGRRIAVMIDGRPDKMPVYGCSVSQTMPLSNIERVEVVEGPASALYGSGAIGGAINIVTRGAQKSFEGDVQADIGSYNTRHLRLRGGAVKGDNDFFAAVDRRTSDGYIADTAYEGNDYTLEYGRKLGDASLRLRNKLYTGTEHDPVPVNPATGVKTPGASPTWFDYRRGGLDLTGAYDAGDFRYDGRLFTTYGRHSFSDGWLSEDQTYGAALGAGWSNGRGASAKAGAEYSSLMGKRVSGTPGAWNKNEYALFASGRSPLGNFVFLDGAMRWAGDTTDNSVWLPAAGVTVKPWNQLEFYTSVSKGMRFPALNELYLYPISNPNLKPETAWGYEGGVRYKPAETVFLRGAAYMSEGHNLIMAQSGKFSNVGDFLFRGLLAELKIKVTEGLNLNGSYNYLDAGSQTTGRPGHTATGGLAYASDDVWGVSADCLYAAKYYAGDNSTLPVNDIFTVNTRAWYNLAADVQVFASANNLLDRRYVIYATNTSATGLFTMPGFTVSGGLKYTFGG